MTGELVLSASSISAFEECHYRYYLQYVEMHEGASSWKSAIGTAVHIGAEAYYRAFLDPSAYPDEDPVKAAIEAAEMAYLVEVPAIVDAERELLALRAVVARATSVYIEEVASQIRGTVLDVEVALQATIDGIGYSGHLDVLQDGLVRDTKVLGNWPRYPDEYRRALTGYDLLAEQAVGDRMADRVIDVVKRLLRDRPQYRAISYGESTRRDVDDFRRGLHDAASGIQRNDFTPTGAAKGICRFCPVRYLCNYAL